MFASVTSGGGGIVVDIGLSLEKGSLPDIDKEI
jgi:hypothetical protein